MHVYIIDDDPMVRRMVLRMLEVEGVDCRGFASADDFLDLLDQLLFGCILLDVSMPDRNGLDVLSQVLARQPFPVVMVSGSTDINDAITSFRHGAVHFLRKPFGRNDLMTSLREAEKIGLERKVAAERRAEAERIRLTSREQEVLAALTEGQASKAIAWGLGLSVRTVEMHRSNILDKLRAKNCSEAVSIARMLHLLPQRTPARL